MQVDVFNKLLGDVAQRQIDTQGKGVPHIGLSIGFDKIDDAIGGLRPDTVTTIAARTGMGKTALALSIVISALERGHKVTYLSFEMSMVAMGLRLLSMFTGIPPNEIERGRFTDQQLVQLRAAAAHILTFPLNVVERGLQSDQITDYVGNNFGDTELLVIDHIGILRDPITSRYEKMTLVSNNVRGVARDLNIPVLSLAQLNRQADNRENHTPQNSDLRDAGAIEEDSEIIMFPYRPYYYAANDPQYPEIEFGKPEKDAQIIISKNRQGPTGRFSAWFYPHSTVWTDKVPPPRLPASTQNYQVPPRQFVSGKLSEMVKKG